MSAVYSALWLYSVLYAQTTPPVTVGAGQQPDIAPAIIAGLVGLFVALCGLLTAWVKSVTRSVEKKADTATENASVATTKAVEAKAKASEAKAQSATLVEDAADKARLVFQDETRALTERFTFYDNQLKWAMESLADLQTRFNLLYNDNFRLTKEHGELQSKYDKLFDKYEELNRKAEEQAHQIEELQAYSDAVEHVLLGLGDDGVKIKEQLPPKPGGGGANKHNRGQA